MFIHDYIRESILSKKIPKSSPQYDFESLKKTEWNSDFEEKMRNRLIFGAFRYGLLNRQSVKFDVPAYIKVKLDRYIETGNLEALVDVANLALIEYSLSEHPNKHFSSLDDAEHAQIKK